MNDFSRNIVSGDISILQALDIINSIGKVDYQTLFVIDEQKQLIGTVTDGDIRRALLKGCQLTDAISVAAFRNYRSIQKSSYSLDEITEFRKNKILLVPVIDNDKRIIRIIDFNRLKSILPIDSVIMAGGKGERLLPLTLNTPKPLLKVGDKAIIEHNVDRLAQYGIEKISITTGYLSNQIVDFFSERKYDNMQVAIVEEESSMGTIGGLSLISHFEHDIVFVMNADLLTNIDVEDFLKFFLSNESDMCVATIPYKISIPYAVLETQKNNITAIEEKPVYTYYSNAGIYLIKKSMLNLIPHGKRFDATDLITAMLDKKHRVHHYAIKGYWLDIGKPEDYARAQEDIKIFTD